MTGPGKSKAFALADAHFAVCQRVEVFFCDSVRPIADRIATRNSETDTYAGALIRVHAWLRSLAKLNHPGDFQPILSASRTLFEVAVDLTLLEHDPDSPCAKLLAWEDSAKLHGSERMKEYCDANPQAQPIGGGPILAYLSQKSRIVALRQSFWKRKDHPARWTGRNLKEDARVADGLRASGFLEYYCARYPQVCWNVHGSALAGVRSIEADTFPALTAFGLAECANFAVLAAASTLRLLGRWDDISAQRFEKLHRELEQTRLSVWIEHLQEYPGARPPDVD